MRIYKDRLYTQFRDVRHTATGEWSKEGTRADARAAIGGLR